MPLPPAVAAPDPFTVDDMGFVNSGARCDGTQTAVAVGRTVGSLVVICGDRNGRSEARVHCAERERHLLDLPR
jgi:hypothetical protein